MKTLPTSQVSKRMSKQQGLTLIELTVSVAIVAVFAAVALLGVPIWQKQKGANEGKAITLALSCALTSINASNFSSITLATLVNIDCFGGGSNIVGKGTTAATATSKLAGTTYGIASVGLGGGTNNALEITVDPISKSSCKGVVEALDSMASRIVLTPASGSAVTIKAVSGNIDDAALGLACNSADSVSIAAAASRS